MNPNYIHTITLYRKGQGASYERLVIPGCFWKSGQSVTQNGTEASMANTYTVRIPEEAVGTGFSVSLGDLVVLGECEGEITGRSPDTAAELLHRCKPNAFKVTAVTDNTSHRMGRHYRLGG